MRIVKSLFFFVLALLLAPSSIFAATVKIGIILPYSGPNAQIGQQLDRGMELYVKLHPNELGGHKIQLIKRDSTGPKPDVAKRLAQELITRDKVDIIGGIVYSNNALAIAGLSKKAKVPILIMNAGAAVITTKSPYIARVSFTMWQAAYPLGEYAYKNMGIKTVAVAYANYAPGKDSKTAFITSFKKAGGKVVVEIPFPFPKIPDFTPFLQRVKDSKPDGLYVFIPAGKWATGVIKTYGDLGMKEAGITLFGPGDITQDSELPNMGDVPIGIITMHHYSAAGDRPENKKFVKAWKEAYGANTTPDFFGVQGWDGMAALYEVVRRLGGKITAEKAIEVWKGWKFNSPRGPIMIDPETRDIVANQYLRKVEKRGGKLANIEFKTIEMVKDPWKELQKKK
ncbi:MAG: ABC transporter substrate-binding protein [Deltaproteobacteria bacterium]|nr:ABC transporter substrate-binding protein [Deltaproteobacteria bacterium]